MSKIHNDITAVVGKTPLVKINKMGHSDVTILVKLESCNPCGSVKDRIAVSMIEAAEKAGSLNPEAIVAALESTDRTGAMGRVRFHRGHQVIFGNDPNRCDSS